MIEPKIVTFHALWFYYRFYPCEKLTFDENGAKIAQGILPSTRGVHCERRINSVAKLKAWWPIIAWLCPLWFSLPPQVDRRKFGVIESTIAPLENTTDEIAYWGGQFHVNRVNLVIHKTRYNIQERSQTDVRKLITVPLPWWTRWPKCTTLF
jgi:hypothetical protein